MKMMTDQVSLSLNELINQDEDILIHSLKHQQQRNYIIKITPTTTCYPHFY